MASSILKQDADISDDSSISTMRTDSWRSSSSSTGWRSLSQLTPASSPNTPMTSCSSLASSQTNYLFESPSTEVEAGMPKGKEIARARTYTRRIVETVRRPATIQTILPRTRSGTSVSSPLPLTSSQPPLTSTALSRQLALGPTQPRVKRRPVMRHIHIHSHIHPDQIAIQNPNNIYTYGPAHGPDPSKLPHPIPNILVTDYSLLLSAATRYASSPRCLSRAQPIHHIADPRFLGRYSASEGVNTARCRSQGFEVADVEMFAEMGGQESVVFLGCKRPVQRKVVARGCPSCACSCKGRGVAMARCWDWIEDEEEEEVGWSGLRPCRQRRLPVTDRIEEARYMRARIEQRRGTRQVRSKEREEQLNANPHEGRVEVKRGPGKIKTIRRRKSKFIEVGCTPGNDLAETSATGASMEDGGTVGTVVAGSGGGQDRKRSSSSVTKQAPKSWIKKLLHV